MTKLEFIEAIKVLIPNIAINDSICYVKFNDIRISLKDWPTVKVVGKIPYEVAQTIYKNYPCDKLGISVSIVGKVSCPDLFLTDDILKSEINRSVPNETFEQSEKRIEKARKKLAQRPNEKKYLEMYKVSRKEGLIVVIKELESYYAKKEQQDLSSKKDIIETISTVNLNIIKKINPCISSYAWIMNGINRKEYYVGRSKENGNSSLQEFRRALDEFDRIVNPFMEQDLAIEEIVQALKEKQINTTPFKCNKEYEENFKYYIIEIMDTETRNSVDFGINPTGFSYSCFLKLSENNFISIEHFYCDEKKEENRGEILSITYFKDNSRKKEIRYNITKGTIGNTNEPKKPATNLQIANIYLELIELSEKAANITINNLPQNKKDYLEQKLSNI